MSNWYVTDTILDALKTRFLQWVLDDMKGCDENIRSLLLRLNQNPDVVPVFSCEGHVGTEKFSAYIMFAANERGFDWLARAFNFMLTNASGIEMRTNIEFKVAQRVLPPEYGKSFHVTNESHVYPAILVSCDILDEYMQDIFLRLFNEAIDKIPR